MRPPVFRPSLGPTTNLVPFVTVFMQLVFFFCCTNIWMGQDYSDAVSLPHSDWGQQRVQDASTWVVVNMSRTGQMCVAGRSVDGMELERLLRAERRFSPSRDVGVLVRADYDVSYGMLSPIFRAARRVNVRHVNFALLGQQRHGSAVPR